MNRSLADPLRKEVSIATVAFRPRSQAALGPAPPGAPQKEHPQPRVRPMRATCCAAPHAPRGGRTPSLCRGRRAGRPGLPSPGDRPDTPLSAPEPPERPPGPYEHLLENDTSRAEICALDPRFPRPPERFQTRPLLGPPRARAGHLLRRQPPPWPRPRFPAAPLSSYGLPAPETLRLGPPGRFTSVAGTSSDPSQPSLGHTNRGGPRSHTGYS